MQQIILASRNPGKVREFAAMFSPLGYEILPLSAFPQIEDIVEDGETFVENARIKAETVSRQLGMAVLADDSGLVVHYLGGQPGVRSARFAEPGATASDAANNAKLLAMLDGVPLSRRQAHFAAALAYARPGQETLFTEGRCFGLIWTHERGSNGFGYDPLFYLPQFSQTMAELAPAAKNQISHRAKALRSMADLIRRDPPPTCCQ
ncbi:MAG: XTP/dITP diphosphatase [Bacillota bacterium]|jgi:XTP/dITP diphosphohydrolase